jgi:maleamate amidohydrolase
MILDRVSAPMGQRPALVLVDMMKGFTDPSCPLGSEAEPVVAANQQLLDAFRAKNLPVFFTRVVYDNPSQGRAFRVRVPALEFLQRGSPWTEFDDRLAPLSGEVIIEKHYASAFFGTDLATQLSKSRADCLIVTGLTTSGCVRATVVDALQHDYAVFVPREAVGDRNPSAHAANLHDMHAKYGDVCGVSDVLAHVAELG